MRDLLAMLEDIDVREVLPTLSVPTLVMSRRDDPTVPIAWAKEMAAAIPGARFVELDGADHYARIGDVEQWLDAIEPFITGVEPPVASRPNLGSVSFAMATTSRLQRGDLVGPACCASVSRRPAVSVRDDSPKR
jgi:hypothetical protein